MITIYIWLEKSRDNPIGVPCFFRKSNDEFMMVSRMKHMAKKMVIES
jgi:hypothetical protein